MALALLACGLARAGEQPGAVSTSLLLFAGNDRGLWRSSDWGASWELLDRGPLSELGAARAIVPVGPRVWVGGAGGLFVSSQIAIVRSNTTDTYVNATAEGCWR